MFSNMDLRKCDFYDCVFEEANFEGADLSGTTLKDCDFNRAIFENTNLSKTDLSCCKNLIMNPDSNNIAKATFSKENLIGLLSKYDIRIK